MAANNIRWVKNLNDPKRLGPRITKGLVAAASVLTCGDLIERTGNTNTEWVRQDSDHDATSTKLGIAAQDKAATDPIGYYKFIEPLDGDVFEFPIDTASAVVPEDALYWSATNVLAISGNNIIGYTVSGAPNSPAAQNQLSEGQLGDNGVTFRSTKRVWFVFRAAVSTYSLQQRA